VHKIVR